MATEPPRDRDGKPFIIHLPEDVEPNPADNFHIEIPEDELPPVPLELDEKYRSATLPPVEEEPEEFEEPEKPVKTKKRNTVIIVICSVIGVFLVGICLLLLFSQSGSKSDYKDYISQGADLYTDGNYSKSVASYKKALNLKPESTEAKEGIYRGYLAMAEQAITNENYDEAIHDMELCYAVTDLQKAYDKANEYRTAKTDAETAAQLEEDLAYAESYASQKNYEKAAAYYRSCYDLTGDEKYLTLAEEMEAAIEDEKSAEDEKKLLTSSLESGTYSGTQLVNLTCGDPSARIYYTLDDTAPSQGSTSYSGAIKIGPDAGTYVLRAVPYFSGVRGEEIRIVIEIK